jgi:hypothetical protein
MEISNEERKHRDAERQREYRKTHKPNLELHRIRSKRYYDKHFRKTPIDTPKLPKIPKIKREILTIEQKKTRHAKSSKIYRDTHIENKDKKNKRQARYQAKTHNIKRGVLTHYGGGKCACIKCGIDDIDCLNLDHINNDAHHRQNNGRVGGEALYRKLMNQNYPIGYQTLCHNCNQKKALEFCRKNGGHKKGKPMETTLPLLEIIQEDAETCHFDIMGA